MPVTYSDFSQAIYDTEQSLLYRSYPVKGSRWQSMDISQYGKEMYMREIFNVNYQIALKNSHPLQHFQEDIQPNLPWAEDHFQERVCGLPFNPGVQWANWPYAHSANRHRNTGERFSHTYMERMWPKAANQRDDDELMMLKVKPDDGGHIVVPRGIRYHYGDLKDVVEHLFKDPLTRQAYLPIWFPEDTGVVHGERVPCTLGYHFLHRHGFLHCTYYIRSCDFVRHYRDDLYLTLRLMQWVLEELKEKEDTAANGKAHWNSAKLGFFCFNCVSMHCFEHDYLRLLKDAEEKKSKVNT